MKILIISSHKGSRKLTNNLHLQNAKIIADRLNADLIWSYEGVNDEIKEGYDKIIFSHASQYAFVDYEWVKRSPNADLYSISNEFNLGESRLAWLAKKEGRFHTVIANHDSKISKIVTKYTNGWYSVNLNALIFDQHSQFANNERSGCIYYGSFRKNRVKYFKKYLDLVTVSTHPKNVEKFKEAGVEADFIKRIDWKKEGLANYKSSLYIEDEVTHNNYNHLANRFYEALNYDVYTLFAEECLNTIELSGYDVPDDFIVYNTGEILAKTEIPPYNYKQVLEYWKAKATIEKEEVLDKIERIVYN